MEHAKAARQIICTACTAAFSSKAAVAWSGGCIILVIETMQCAVCLQHHLHGR